MIKGFTRVNQPEEIHNLIEEIIDKQYVGHSTNTIEKDVEIFKQDPPKENYVIKVANSKLAKYVFQLITRENK